jgi:hypothetical protein
MVPSSSVEVEPNVTVWSVEGEPGEIEKSAAGKRFWTSTVPVATSLAPFSSVTRRATVYGPADGNERWASEPLASVKSPSLFRSHSSLVIGAPSNPGVEVDVKVTVSPVSGVLEEVVNDGEGFVGSRVSARENAAAVPPQSSNAVSAATIRG